MLLGLELMLLLGLISAPTESRPAQAAAIDPLQALRVLDTRMIGVGTRLSVGNAPICEALQWQAGIAVHDLSQYPASSRAAVVAAFGLGDAPGVLALAAGGAAERAGLRLDDALLAADNVPLPRTRSGSAGTFSPTEAIISALEVAFADGAAALSIRRGGETMVLNVPADRGCASRFQVVPSRRMDAKADGRYVQLTSAMIEFTQDDDELAALVAHELSHNILRHRVRLNAAGVQRGFLAPFGRNGRLFRQVELEADRLAVHLMARAGYDPGAAVRLWTRQSRSDARLFAGTHPDWPLRIQAMQAEITAIAAARARGEVAVPPISRAPLGGPRG